MHTHSSSHHAFRSLLLAIALLAPLSVGLAACSAADFDGLSENDENDSSLDYKAGPPMDKSIPVELKIPDAKGNPSRVLKLGVDKHGNLQVPPMEQAERPGWYSRSVTPGENGVSVLVARLSTQRGSALLPKGALLKVGDKINIKRSDSKTATFIITEVEQRHVKSIAAKSLDLKSNRPELLIIAPEAVSTKEVAHHKTGKGHKEAGSEAKEVDHYNVIFSAVLTQRDTEK
jgi:hypothetical protein